MKNNFFYKNSILGIWGYLSSSVVPDNFEENLVSYLEAIESVLGERLFLEMYIQKISSDEEYLENLNDLNRIALLDDVHNAKELLGMYSSISIVNNFLFVLYQEDIPF